MAIEKLNSLTPTVPIVNSDWPNLLAYVFSLGMALTMRDPVDGSTIPEGTVLYIGGVLYKATSDTAITGTTSNYVKITPSGVTASAAFVANLTGVTWNKTHGGYYDVSGNLYLFDESLAVRTGVVASAKNYLGHEGLSWDSAVDAEALARSNADNAEALARSNADNAEALARSNADNAITTALMTDGAVGSYALLKKTTGGTVIHGNTVAGSELEFSDVLNNTSGTATGIWRCMGYIAGLGGVTLFVRIS